MGTYLAGMTEALGRRFKRQYKMLVRGERTPRRYYRHKFHRHIFPETTIPQVESRIAKFQYILNRFSGIGVRSVSKNIFEITSAHHSLTS